MARILLVPVALATLLAAAPADTPASLWNGEWVLDPARSSPGAPGNAAPGYAFTITPDGGIVWRIPALGEVVTGKVDGAPMPIHRPGVAPGLTLSVRPDGPLVLLYKVARDGKPSGEGRMTLVEGGKAWVDLSWGAGMQQFAGELVYVRK
jgi:hypothetical protein